MSEKVCKNTCNVVQKLKIVVQNPIAIGPPIFGVKKGGKTRESGK